MAGERNGEDTRTLTLLVPFYVNGTLPPDGRARIDAALADDAELRAELRTAHEIAELVQAGGEALTPQPASLQDRLAALLARLEARPAAWFARRAGRAQSPLPARPPRAIWKPAFAAAAALALVQAAVIAYQATARDDAYEVLAGPSAAPAGQLLVRLAPDARWAEVEALLSSRDLAIVGGPRGSSLDIALAPGARVDEEVRRLRASPLVEFAGPAS